MSRVSEILVRMRDSLADNDKTRWSDARLIRLIDEAQTDFVIQAQLLRAKATISIRGGISTYELPTDAYLLTRAVNADGEPLALESHNSMDSTEGVEKDWEATIGNPVTAIIFDKQDPRTIKVYPIPSDSDSIGDTFTIADYGIVTAVEGDLMLADLGAVVDVSTTASETTSFDSVYGAVTDMVAVLSSLTVYYRRIPNTISETTDIPEVEPIWDKALRYYGIAMALADDQDTQNVTMADKYMGLYLRELKEAKDKAARNNVSSSPRKSPYVKAI